jgi:hypothetical protein
MNTTSIVKYGLIAAVLGGVYFFSNSDQDYTPTDINLNAVLDVTVDTFHSYQEELNAKEANGELDALIKNIEGQSETQPSPEELKAGYAFMGIAAALTTNYNKAEPALHTTKIGVSPQTDASLLAFEDLNNNQKMDQGENAIFLIEVDGEQQRVIATSRSGAVNEHHFSGTGLLTGYLIGSMLSRQFGAGVDPKQMANKKPVTAQAAARSRAGSGSHSKGK